MNGSMSDLAWLRTQLDRHTYRPDWQMRIDETAPYLAVLIVEAMVQDTYEPDRQIRIASRNIVPPYLTDERDEAGFTRWLQHALFDIEMHESREWLRRDGEIFDNPHAPAKPIGGRL